MSRSKFLSWALVALFFALFVYYFVTHRQDFAALLDMNPLLLLIVATGYVGLIYVNGIFIKLMIEPFGKKISYIESFKVSLLTSIGNYFGPFLGGTSIRAVYLKKKVGLKYTDFLSTLYGYYVISFFISACLGIFSLFLLRDHLKDASFLPILLFLVVTAFSLLVIIFNKKISVIARVMHKFLGNNAKFLIRLSKSWHQIIAQPGLVKVLVLITIANISIFLLVNYIEFALIGVTLSPGSLALYTTLGIFSILISLTPGALGIREGVYLFSADVIGVSSSQILAVALIDRSIQFLVMFLAWLYIAIVRRRKQQKDEN